MILYSSGIEIEAEMQGETEYRMRWNLSRDFLELVDLIAVRGRRGAVGPFAHAVDYDYKAVVPAGGVVCAGRVR